MNDENEISLKELILILMNQRKLIVLFTLGATLIAIIVSLMMPNVFEAQSQLVYSIPESRSSRFGTYFFPSQNVADYITLLDSLELRSEVAEKMDLDVGIINNSYIYDKDLSYVTVKTQANTPELAKEINDVLVETYINRINLQHKLIAIDRFIYNHQMNIQNMNFGKLTTQSMIDEKSEFLEILKPVYTLQKAVFSDPKSAALFAEKFDLDLGSLSNDVVLEEFVNDKYLALDGEIVDLKLSLINMNESLINSQILLNELSEEKSILLQKIDSMTYEEELNDELTVFKSGVTQISEAVTPIARISPRRTTYVAIGFVIGLMLGVVVAFFKHYWTSNTNLS